MLKVEEIVNKLNEIIKDNPNVFKDKLVKYCKNCNRFKEKEKFKKSVCDKCLKIYMASKAKEYYIRNIVKMREKVNKYNRNKRLKELKEIIYNDTKSR